MKIFLLLITLAFTFAEEDEAQKTYFTAAVFEKADFPYDSTKDAIHVNLKLYAKAAAEAARRGIDILVYPEFGVLPYVGRKAFTSFAENIPHPDEKPNPCEHPDLFADRPIIFTLSCIARENNMYVVANLVDKHPCKDQSDYCDASAVDGCQSVCPPDGFFMYNTNVAFDRSGKLIARYHKNHPYFEQLNIPDKPEYVTFTTDFGTFGMIVCFDSVFQHTINLLQDHEVQHLLFPTHWFDDIVPLNAIEWQQSIAIGNNVNFIAANIHHPGLGTLGSGIYSGKYGALTYTYNPDGKSKLIYARVPLKPGEDLDFPDSETDVIFISEDSVKEEEETGHHFLAQCYRPLAGPAENNYTDYRCFKAQFERYSLQKLKSGAHEIESCSNGLCCSLKYSAATMKEDYYLAVFNGTNDVKGFYKWEEESCFLVRCDPFDGKDCMLFPSVAGTPFEFVELKADITCERAYPTVTKEHYRLAPTSEWSFKNTGKSVILKYESKSDDPLLKLGFIGRCYSRDPPFIPAYKYPYESYVNLL